MIKPDHTRQDLERGHRPDTPSSELGVICLRLVPSRQADPRACLLHLGGVWPPVAPVPGDDEFAEKPPLPLSVPTSVQDTLLILTVRCSSLAELLRLTYLWTLWS